MTDQREFEGFIAGLRLKGLSEEVIKEMFEDALDNVLSDERDAEILGKYS